MKQFKLSLVLTILMSMVGLQAFADFNYYNPVQVGDLYYCLDKANSQAQVTSKLSGKYTGGIAIPSSITYSNKTYGVTSIGSSAFSGCSGLTSITIGNSVTSIGKKAFYGCSGLTKVIISDVAAWCGISFEGPDSNPLCYAHHLYSNENTEITDLLIPDGMEAIGDYAFWGCSGLTSISVPNSVTSIDTGAFYGCTGLTSITIPNSVTSIGNEAFEGCSGITSITIPNSVTSIGFGTFAGCSGLTSVNIPNSVTSIGDSAFWGCSGLTSITIPNSVTSIDYQAFEGCSGLTSITIPNSVTSIGNWAFGGCSGLTGVMVLNPTPITIYEYVFPNRRIATLYVPKGCKGAYQAADYWKEFKEIVEIDPSGIDQISIWNNGSDLQSIGKNTPVIYNLNGLRISAPTKGLNIINGRKVVMK